MVINAKKLIRADSHDSCSLKHVSFGLFLAKPFFLLPKLEVFFSFERCSTARMWRPSKSPCLGGLNWDPQVIPLCRYSAPAVRGIEGVRRTERVLLTTNYTVINVKTSLRIIQIYRIPIFLCHITNPFNPLNP